MNFLGISVSIFGNSARVTTGKPVEKSLEEILEWKLGKFSEQSLWKLLEELALDFLEKFQTDLLEEFLGKF